MNSKTHLPRFGALLTGFALVSGAHASAQVYVLAPISQFPQTQSQTENVDFADVDLDGDWDAAIADGGDTSQDQNRLWLNRGPGPLLGNFVDATAERMPALLDDSRDIEFVDFDQDGDFDLFVANTAQLQNQSNHWLTNVGGVQGGSLGFYQLDDSRWVGVGQPGSSVATSLVLETGGFIDWSCDGDFGDIDNDGDLDLFHSTYGAAFGGQTPSRVFLNDGNGFFSEFNPAGAQLTTTNIANGDRAIWAEGMQAGNTMNTTGVNADVAASPLDIEFGDTDADFDLDLMFGSRQDAPRAFTNRLEETGSLLFRDRTAAIYPAGYWTSGDNYEQELGDMDLDGDLDLYGINYPGFNDATFNSAGNGSFNTMVLMTSSGQDDTEADFVDYDNDGDMDVFISGFRGLNRMYRNDYSGGGPGTFSYTKLTGAEAGLTINEATLDFDGADLDGDGDYDGMSAEDANQSENYYLNTTGVADTHAPYIPHVEQLADASASAAPRPVRAQVYDNAAYYVTWYNPTVTTPSVDGFALPEIESSSAQGQVFRTLLPGNLYGAVQYGFRSSDEHGNTGVSANRGYTSSHASFTSLHGAASLGSLGIPAIQALSVPFGGTTLYLAGSNAPAATLSWIGVTDAAIPTLALPGVCNLNIAGSVLHFSAGLTGASGSRVLGLPIPLGFAGLTVHAQFFALDGTGGNLLSSSEGLGITLQ
jgi:hypothetical protein